MSQKYSYTNTGDDLSHQDMYADSYQRQSSTYRPSVRSSSQTTSSSNKTVDSPVHLTGMALSFLHSCGLDSSDLAHLAELPEHLITVETLPKLLLQVKERKLSSASTSKPSTSQPLDDTSTWESSSHTKPVKYPLDRPTYPVYPLPPEQVQTWQDRWGNPRRTNTLPTGTSSSSSQSSSVPDYSISKDTDPYCGTTKSSEASSRPLVDFGPRPLLSLRIEPPVTVPNRKEAADFNCKIPSAFPYMCGLCGISVRSTKDWFFHVRESGHAKGQLQLLQKYPKWDQTVESARRNACAEVYKVPTRKEASDFNGTVPPVFPYLCVLCNFTVFSEKDWSGHVASGLHAKGQLDLMEKYPKWDGTVRSSRRNDGHPSTDIRDGASRENTSNKRMPQAKDERSSRVVSFTPLPAGDGTTSELTAIAKRFGSVKKSLFLPNWGYVEMASLAEAKKLVKHYSANQLKLKGKLIKVTFSSEYNTLREGEADDKPQSWSSHTYRRSSPGMHGNQRDSASPRRRRSSERTRSSPKRKHSSERTPSSPKRRRSSEKNHSSTRRGRSSERTHSSRSCHVKEHEESQKSKESSCTSSKSHHTSSSVAKDDATKSSADTEEKGSVSNSSVESMDLGSDLEGLEVIADDGEELVHDIYDSEPTSDQENLSSELIDMTDVDTEEQEKIREDSPNGEASEASDSLKEGQKFEEHDDQEIKEADHDFPRILQNCVTLDEFTDDFSDCQESDEPKASIPNAEELSDEVTTDPVSTKQSEKSESPKEESTSITAEFDASETLEDAVEQPKEEQVTERMTDSIQEIFGKVLEVRNLPNTEKYTDLDFMNIIKRYGDVTHHVLFRSCKKGFVEMVLASDAERVASDSKNQDIVLRGHILKIKVSEKYCQLPEEGFSVDSDEEEEEIREGEISKESNNEQQSDALNGNTRSSNESLKIDERVGTEFVRPVVGYFCHLCNVIYATEEEAKDEHCKSPSHHEKVKEHKERSGSVENKK